jgi:hypothetical protein
MSDEHTSVKAPLNEVREVVGIFGNLASLQSAIDELLVSGFDRSEISLLQEDNVVRARKGSDRAVELEDDSRAPRLPYIESESLSEGKAAIIGVLAYIGFFIGAGALTASSGVFASPVMAGAVVGGLAAVAGLLVAFLIGQRQTKWARAQLERGGLLLWVRTWTEQRERQAMSLMQKHGGHHVHVHAVAV